MATSEEREAAFRADLKELLDKHGADITLESDPVGYFTRGYIDIFMETRYDESGEIVDESANFEL